MTDPTPQPDLRGPAVAIRYHDCGQLSTMYGPFPTKAVAEAWINDKGAQGDAWSVEILHNPGESPRPDLELP